MTYSEEQIKTMVRRVLMRTLGPNGVEGQVPARQLQTAAGALRQTVTEADVLAAPVGTRISVSAGAMVTPLARDAARERGVELVQEPSAVLKAAAELPAGERAVALGADHGGYAMKEDLKAYVSELGYAVVDCGTHDASSVDYPDQAYAVAQMVSGGRAWRGIIVDGAGIGSCMAANKVPGVRAAMCYDHATAFNSREHNDANVLTLGGMLLGRNLARQIVKVWLETDFGGGRHARRVDKIMEIEGRFLKK
jgi:ribose 5-phosphate isomerase B